MALIVDQKRFTTKVDGKEVRLAPKEFKILTALMDAGGSPISRERILHNIWSYDKSMKMDSRVIDQHVSRMRRKLGRYAKRVRTVTNQGYQYLDTAGKAR